MRTLIPVLGLFFFYISCSESTLQTVKIWDTLTLDFTGPEADESDEFNPFTNYKMEVIFTHDGKLITVPGYFAADGNSNETSASKGNIWRVKFSPSKLGIWDYEVKFMKGENIAIAHDTSKGEGLTPNGEKGNFKVVAGDFNAKDFRSKGKLSYEPGTRYQKFPGDNNYFLKGGADSPENLLAYADFDGTYAYDSTVQFIKTYSPHVQDWKEGDPSWKGGKGKGLIGALNYLSEKGMNAIYFITMNIEADGKDVWMYRDHEDFTRFDCSKLDQWDIVFSHAQSKGILLHFLTQETENELLLDNGDTGDLRKLYYRELIARFAHYPAVNWNMGEENGPADFTPEGQSDQQRRDMFEYFKKTDPYNNLVVLHTHSYTKYKDTILEPLLGDLNLDGLSLQIDKPYVVHEEIKKWKQISMDAGKEWIMNMDEIGQYWKGVMPDKIDPDHDTIRSEVLWGSLTAGAAGVEWYFGYKFPPADLDCEDWRSRDKMWDQTKYALEFYEKHLPFWEMESNDKLISNPSNYCFAKEGEIYLIYFKKDVSSDQINLEQASGKKLKCLWFNPKTGEETSIQEEIFASDEFNIEKPESFSNNDMVFLIKVIN